MMIKTINIHKKNIDNLLIQLYVDNTNFYISIVPFQKLIA
jgi:hypothetical protein